MFKSKEFKIAVLFTLVAISIAFGLSDLMNFWKSFAIITAFESIIYYFVIFNEDPPATSDNSEFDKIVEELGGMVEEQGGVIKEYEDIFDQQLVELPCVCGGNTFRGLFSPKVENIVECEKCESKYRVTVNYNSVLISEPLDINDDSLIKKMQKVKKTTV
jgi:hypothetical protein